MVDNDSTKRLWGIIKIEMYQMYEITDESLLGFTINDEIKAQEEQ